MLLRDRILSSPSDRCARTLGSLAAARVIELELHPDLREGTATSAVSCLDSARRQPPVGARGPRPAQGREIADLRRVVAAELAPCLDAVGRHQPASVVVAGGPVRAPARVIAAASGERPDDVDRYRIDIDQPRSWTQRLLWPRLDEHLELPGMKTRRADRVHHAALVLHETLGLVDLGHLQVGDAGSAGRRAARGS